MKYISLICSDIPKPMVPIIISFIMRCC